MISKYIKVISLIGFSGLVLSGCVGGQLYIPEVNEEEVGTYEKKYMKEYEVIKQNNINYKTTFKWIQPKNKKDECKIWVGYNPKDDRTSKVGYELFWDGSCKDGYANGLGSVFENTQFADRQQIAYYNDGNPDKYCVNLNPLNGITKEGECLYYTDKPSHYVTTTIDEKNGDLNVLYEFGVSMSKNSPAMKINTSIFTPVVSYEKIYPNFSYLIKDYSKDKFFHSTLDFAIRDHKMNANFNGYGFVLRRNGYLDSMELNNGNRMRSVKLPQSYLEHANRIQNEINNAANIALDAQKKALIIKEKYKKKICKVSVKVKFMDNNEYKSICNEDKKIATLKEKIDIKLAKINEQKQLKLEQLNQQRMIRAREVEAAAAQRQAKAAESANFQRSMDSISRNMQMQQLNNNLMMYNFMPKTHNVYIH